jgi:hypothetical protein
MISCSEPELRELRFLTVALLTNSQHAPCRPLGRQVSPAPLRPDFSSALQRPRFRPWQCLQSAVLADWHPWGDFLSGQAWPDESAISAEVSRVYCSADWLGYGGQMRSCSRATYLIIGSLLWGQDALAYGERIAQTQQQNAILDSFQNRTRTCYAESITALAQQGVTDANKLEGFAAKTCSAPLYHYLTSTLGYSKDQAVMYLAAIMATAIGDVASQHR